LSPSKFGVSSYYYVLTKIWNSDNKMSSLIYFSLLTSSLVSLSHKTRLALYG